MLFHSSIKRLNILAVGCLASLSSFAVDANAQTSPRFLTVNRMATGLSNPLYATHAPGDASRLFVVEQSGNIKIMNTSTGAVNATPFLTAAQLSSAGNGLTTGGERGLLGLAFDPNYATNRRFYVNYTGTGGHTFVRSFVTQAGNPDLVDGNNGAANILNFNQDFSNHNGGWMGFGQDGHLYVASGDGGSGNDPNNRALDRNSFLGKMLRITPNTTSAGGYSVPTNNPFVGVAGTRSEIWAYGLRNPWRNSFDRATGDLYIADVGQNAREEINFQAANAAGGRNYGWRTHEGTGTTGLSGQAGTATRTDPIYQYEHSAGFGRSITGGYVYRGPIEALQGNYFYADFAGQTMFSFQYNGSTNFNGNNVTQFVDWTNLIRDQNGNTVSGSWSSFGEDATGNLYAIDYSGNVYRFTAGAIPEPGSALALLGASIALGLKRRRKA